MKVFLPISVVVLTAALLIGTGSPSRVSTVDAKVAAALPGPPEWPDLTTLQYPNGKTCSIDGAGQPGSEKSKLNNLKNRFRLPSGDFQAITFDTLLGLNQGRATGSASKRKIVDFPGSGDPDNQRPVSLEGYVESVFAAGCAKHANSQGESCNCNTISKSLCDAHINFLPTKKTNHAGGRNTYVVEVTERIRRLAKLGLLSSNIGNDWSTPKLQEKLIGHRVRFSGFLFFDTDHVSEAWVSDPKNNIGGNNFRQTCWEIHPVMKIEVLN
jgi:hypothetical protein